MTDRWKNRPEGEMVPMIDEDLDKEIEEIVGNNPLARYGGAFKWSEREIYILRKMYGRTAVKNITKLLPSRTIDAITKKAQKLGLVQERT